MSYDKNKNVCSFEISVYFVQYFDIILIKIRSFTSFAWISSFLMQVKKKSCQLRQSGLLIKRKTWRKSNSFSDTETIPFRIAQSSPWRESSSGVMIKTRRGGTIEGHDRSNAHPHAESTVTAERIAEKPRSQLR